MEEEKNSKETNSANLKATVIEEKDEEETKKRKHEINEENYIIQDRKKCKWLIIAIAIVIGLAFLLTGFALLNINNKNIISGVTIDKINVQGLTKVEAKEVISKKIEEKINKEINIKIDNEENTILLSQIELEYNIEDAIDKAYSVGRNSNIFINNFEIIKSKIIGTNIGIEAKYNEELLNNIIEEIKRKIPNGVQEPDFCIEEENLIITKGRPGLSINEESLKEFIKESLNLSYTKNIELKTINATPKDIDIEKIYNEVHKEAQDAYYTTNPFQIFAEVIGIDFNIEEAKEILKEDKEEYIIQLTITNPNKTIKDIGTEAFPDLLSTFSTRYDASIASRTTNLKIAVNKINGVTVMPGETFSYNKTLGKRTAEAGYQDAAGYAGGKVVQMIGGGICQVSSTLYDAVVYANLDIVERHNHAFTTSYVGAGKDATVVYGSLDFKFKNTRNYPIQIKASAQNGIVTISIYGIKEGTEYDIEISTTILNYLQYSVVYEDDASLAEGEEKVTQNGSRGCKSITYKIYKLNGVEVSRSVLSTDTYDPMNKYISRGTKKTTNVVTPETPEEPTEPTSPTTPEEPTTPTVPTTPEMPEEPTEPTTPTTPEKPEEPTTPETPGTPETPETSEEPTTP